MKWKILKIFLITTFILFSLISLAFATEQNLAENEVTPEQALDQVASVTKVTTLSNLPEANLGLNNILNILLLAVGFLLILFAIAILIRLKK